MEKRKQNKSKKNRRNLSFFVLIIICICLIVLGVYELKHDMGKIKEAINYNKSSNVINSLK